MQFLEAAVARVGFLKKKKASIYDYHLAVIVYDRLSRLQSEKGFTIIEFADGVDICTERSSKALCLGFDLPEKAHLNVGEN